MDVRREDPATPVDSRNILSIQYLRGVAAAAVLLYHIPTNRFGTLLGGWMDWGDWGVDIFFVISGFVMWRTSMSSRSTPATFMLNRIARIYPLYWITLTAWIVARLIVPDSLRNSDFTLSFIAHSYALIPALHPVYEGFAWPILTQGWTLQVEMFFYALVAATLLIGSVAVRGGLLVLVLVGLVVAGVVFEPRGAIGKTYTEPLLIEFAIGIVLAMFYPRLVRGSVAVGVPMIVLGIVVLTDRVFTMPSIASDVIAAALVVTGALLLEKTLVRRPIAALRLLGDSSYSLYLTHTITIAVAATVWARLRLDGHGGWSMIAFPPFALVTSIVAAVVVYKWIEAPLMRVSRRLLRAAGTEGLPRR